MAARLGRRAGMSGVGWRLTMEPCADLVAWSLIRADDAHPEGEVWSGLIADASRLRALTARLSTLQDVTLDDPTAEAIAVRELGLGLLPSALRHGLDGRAEPPLLTLCVRGWLARVPWDALALDWNGVRLIERCILLGGLPPGIAADAADPRPQADAAAACLWIVDPGPPDGPWRPLYPGGYPDALRAAHSRAAHSPAATPPTDASPADALVPDGLPFSQDDLADALASGPWGRMAYLGHVTASSDSPAAAGLVLSDGDGADVFTAHAWFRDPERWPAPERVALLGCGSDDATPFEQTGLATAALHAGASLVTATRWALPNSPGTVSLALAVDAAHASHGVLPAIRRWQLAQLDRWRRFGTSDASPRLWASLVTYDRRLLTGEGVMT